MNDQKQQIVEKLRGATNILVTVSNDPTADQLAACIGLTLLLDKAEKHATAVFSGKIPKLIEFLHPEKTLETNTDSLRDFIISLDKAKADKLRYKVEDEYVKIFITPYGTSLSEKDLIFSEGDFNVDVIVGIGVHNQQDLDSAITAHGRILHDATVVCINIEPKTELGTVNWLDQSASSLSELIASLSDDLGERLIDERIATALLTGIVAETNHFGNEQTTPQTLKISATLLEAGANQRLVAEQLTQMKQLSPKAAADTFDAGSTLPATDSSADTAVSLAAEPASVPAIQEQELPAQKVLDDAAANEPAIIKHPASNTENLKAEDDEPEPDFKPENASDQALADLVSLSKDHPDQSIGNINSSSLKHDDKTGSLELPEAAPKIFVDDEITSKANAGQPEGVVVGQGVLDTIDQAATTAGKPEGQLEEISKEDLKLEDLKLDEPSESDGQLPPHLRLSGSSQQSDSGSAAPATGDETVDSARKAVEDALKGISPDDEPLAPLEALNANPIDLNLFHDLDKQAEIDASHVGQELPSNPKPLDPFGIDESRQGGDQAPSYSTDDNGADQLPPAEPTEPLPPVGMVNAWPDMDSPGDKTAGTSNDEPAPGAQSQNAVLPHNPAVHEAAPLGMSPADQAFTMPLPPKMSIPPPQAYAPTGSNMPPTGPPPPPSMPPPLPPPGFGQ